MQTQLRIFAPFLCLLPLSFAAPGHAAPVLERTTLDGGWYAYAPYAYIEHVRGFPRWTGLDVELLNEIADRAGYTIQSPELEWAEHVRAIETGERDLAPTATKTPEREAFAYFSVPYRTESIALIVPAGRSAALPAKNDVDLVALFKRTGFRLGVFTGAAYPSAAIRAFLADPANGNQVVSLGSHQQLLHSLLRGHVDGFLSDRIVAATLISVNDVGNLVEEHPVLANGDLHLMFSKASVSPEVVADFNRAIESVHADGTYRQLNEKYAFPILVGLTLNSRWFHIVDILGTIAFALSGVLLAFRYNYDIFGALVLASLPAVGGGVVRDLLTNRETLAVLSSPIYIEIVAGLVIGGFVAIRLVMAVRRSRLGAAAAVLFSRRREQVGFLIQVFDAVGLAAFTVTGVVVALATQSTPLWLWGPILAAITAAGGGILRDVVRSDPEVPMLKGELYPEIAVLWGLVLSLYFAWETRQLNADQVAFGIVVTFVGAFVTRVATMYFGIRSPQFPVHA